MQLGPIIPRPELPCRPDDAGLQSESLLGGHLGHSCSEQVDSLDLLAPGVLHDLREKGRGHGGNDVVHGAGHILERRVAGVAGHLLGLRIDGVDLALKAKLAESAYVGVALLCGWVDAPTTAMEPGLRIASMSGRGTDGLSISGPFVAQGWGGVKDGQNCAYISDSWRTSFHEER